MPEELKNIEKVKIEISKDAPESNLENVDISKNIETHSEKSHEQQQEATQTISSSQNTQILPDEKSADEALNKQIEQILESNLRELYMNMPKQKQEEFKKKGEQVIVQINVLLKDVKIKVKKIFSLIFEWLSVIPGINKVFLKQEAKIKTDKILVLKDKQIELNSKK